MKPVQVQMYMCGNSGCGRKHVQMKYAEECCECSKCGEPKGHNMGGQSTCNKCQEQLWRERDMATLLNAKQVPYHNGMVLHDNSDHYFEDDDAIFCHLNDNYDSIKDFPDYFFVSEKVVGVELDMHEVVANYVENNHHEEAMDHIEFLGPLQRYVDIWCQRQTVTSFNSTTSEIVSVADLIKELKMEFEFEEDPVLKTDI